MSLGELLSLNSTFSVRCGGMTTSHSQLQAQAGRVRDCLRHLGVGPGDRVGLRMHKSADAVAAIFGVLQTGAAYVPVDADSPVARGALIFGDCGVKVIIAEPGTRQALGDELAKVDSHPKIVYADELVDAPQVNAVVPKPEDVAYILYTSGSTGRPKGVVLTHGNAISFLDWCSATFKPGPEDVFSSHAPFHFDLSILDVFLPAKHGATLVLIGEDLGKDPQRLAAAIAEERITRWYSTPSILNLLCEYGKLERHGFEALQSVLFAGEVFPVPRFCRLREHWPHPSYYNLYGPTETNVCTWYEVPDDESWRMRDTFPIGRVCPPNEGRVVDEAGCDVDSGTIGELVIAGPNVMREYWNRPELTAAAFLVDEDGRRWYRTGDLVIEGAGGEYTYRGRRDRMVKRRGYRVELGEIEAALLRHPDIRESAAVAVLDEDSGVRITAFVSCQPGRVTSIIGLKTHASRHLPPYMVPDRFKVVDALPRTSTDKIDLQRLKAMA